MPRSLLALALLTACEPALTETPTPLPATELAPPSDPSTSSTNGWCRYNYRWNGTRARVTHPSNGGCGSSIHSPLVVLVHAAGTGQSYGHQDYDYLQKHLAKNGYITVSIEYGDASYQDAATIAQDFLEDFLWTRWSKRAFINPSSIALVGHSRGGAAVRELAHRLENHPTFDVDSVVTLAAGSAGPDLDGDQTSALLSIYGTNDTDTSPGATYGAYDRAGSAGSQFDPTWNNQVIYRSVKLLEDAVHTGYSDFGNADVQNAVKGYVLAFLGAHHKNDTTWYESYIRGDEVPGAFAAPVYSTYRDGFYRRTIDDFDDGTLLSPTVGGNAFATGGYAAVVDAPYPHDTWALQMYATQFGGIAQWELPSGVGNTTAFEWLSMRIAQLDGAPSDDLFMQIRNGTQWSPQVRVTDHGVVAQPLDFCYGLNGYGCLPHQVENHTAMATVRVPLAAFGDHDNVTDVRFVFHGDAVGPTFLVDDLEFSEWIFKP